MKLWVAVFVAAVCALHLPHQGDAGQHHFKYESIAKRGEGSRISNVLVTSVITLKRKYPNENINKIDRAVERIKQSLSEEERKSDHLEAIIIGKYGDGSYTEDDKEFFAALLDVFEQRDLRSIHLKMKAKYPGNSRKLWYAPDVIFPALTVNELKSPNIFQIIEDKYAAFMDQEA